MPVEPGKIKVWLSSDTQNDRTLSQTSSSINDSDFTGWKRRHEVEFRRKNFPRFNVQNQTPPEFCVQHLTCCVYNSSSSTSPKLQLSTCAETRTAAVQPERRCRLLRTAEDTAGRWRAAQPRCPPTPPLSVFFITLLIWTDHWSR